MSCGPYVSNGVVIRAGDGILRHVFCRGADCSFKFYEYTAYKIYESKEEANIAGWGYFAAGSQIPFGPVFEKGGWLCPWCMLSLSSRITKTYKEAYV